MKMKVQEKRAKKTSLAIALVRQNNENSFTRKELVNKLSDANCPYPIRTVALLKKLGLTTRAGGKYYFINPDPIYYGVLMEGMSKIAAKSVGKENKETITLNENPITLNESQIIEVLKKLGYKIFKPVTEFKEC